MSNGFLLKGHLPEAFWEHRRAARREHLLAYRSLFDAAIERLERKSPPTVEAEWPKRCLRELLPEEFWDHLWAAGREECTAYRILCDTLTARRRRKAPAKAIRIEVE